LEHGRTAKRRKKRRANRIYPNDNEAERKERIDESNSTEWPHMNVQSALMIKWKLPVKRAGRTTIRPMKDRAQQPCSTHSFHIRAVSHRAEVFGYLAVYNVGGGTRTRIEIRRDDENTRKMKHSPVGGNRTALNIELQLLTIPPITHITSIHPSIINAPDIQVAPSRLSHPNTQRIRKKGIQHTLGASKSFSTHLVSENTVWPQFSE